MRSESVLFFTLRIPPGSTIMHREPTPGELQELGMTECINEYTKCKCMFLELPARIRIMGSIESPLAQQGQWLEGVSVRMQNLNLRGGAGDTPQGRHMHHTGNRGGGNTFHDRHMQHTGNTVGARDCGHIQANSVASGGDALPAAGREKVEQGTMHEDDWQLVQTSRGSRAFKGDRGNNLSRWVDGRKSGNMRQERHNTASGGSPGQQAASGSTPQANEHQAAASRGHNSSYGGATGGSGGGARGGRLAR